MMQMGFKEWFMVNPPIISTILVFSVLLVAFTFERMWVFRQEAKFPKELWDRIVGLVRERKLRDAIALCEGTPGVFARVFRSGLEGALVSRLDAEDGMVIEKEEGQEILRKRVGMFGTISFISPLIGLVGNRVGRVARLPRFGQVGLRRTLGGRGRYFGSADHHGGRVSGGGSGGHDLQLLQLSPARHLGGDEHLRSALAVDRVRREAIGFHETSQH
jgi:hypothetical protein